MVAESGKGGKVHDALAQIVVGIVLQTGRHKIICNGNGNVGAVHAGVIGQVAQPAQIIPADAGFQLLAGNHIIGVLRHVNGHLVCCHQTGIKAHNVQVEVRVLLAVVVQGIVDLMNGQTVVVGGFVKAHTGGAATVIPQHQNVAVGRVGVHCPGHKIGERFLVGHALPGQHLQVVEGAIGDGEAVDGLAGKIFVIPGVSAARLHGNGDLFRQVNARHLVHILHAGTLQVGAAHIHHDGGGWCLCPGGGWRHQQHGQYQQRNNVES